MSNTLTRLEGVNNFTEFVKAFSQFGSEMVDFALVTGDRQNDLKDERRRAQMSAARTILERSTLMLLTASKVFHLSTYLPIHLKLIIYYIFIIYIIFFLIKAYSCIICKSVAQRMSIISFIIFYFLFLLIIISFFYKISLIYIFVERYFTYLPIHLHVITQCLLYLFF